jgi:hypothetical protein
MKITLGVIFGFLIAAAFTWAAAGITMISDGSGGKVPVQAAAPGRNSGVLAVGHVTKNLTGKTWAGVYCATADIKFRMMSTATVVGTQFTAPAGTLSGFAVNSTLPFRQYSTSVAGEYYEQ